MLFFKNQGKNNRVPTFFYVFSKIYVVKNTIFQVWDIEKICNIAKFRKNQCKNDRVPTFFYVKIFRWTRLKTTKSATCKTTKKTCSKRYVKYENKIKYENKYISIVCNLVAVTSSGISKVKQKVGLTFNFNNLGGIDFTKFSKLTMQGLEA